MSTHPTLIIQAAIRDNRRRLITNALCMDLFFQAQARRPEPAGHRKSQLKAKFPNLYYGKSHLECYHFSQQCEDHFNTAGAIGFNCTLFAASFFRGRISSQWHQHKRRDQAAGGRLSWVEFKAFLQKNLGDSRAFVDTIWSRKINETPSTNKRKFRTGPLTSNTSSLSLLSLILTEPQKSLISFDSSEKVLSLW